MPPLFLYSSSTPYVQMTLALFSPPPKTYPNLSPQKNHFAQSAKQLWETIASTCVQDIIASVARKLWSQNRLACQKNHIFSILDISTEISLRLFQEATRHVEQGIIGLRCPQAWIEHSFSSPQYLYKIIYYLGLRSIQCSKTIWNGLPEESYRLYYHHLLSAETPLDTSHRGRLFEHHLASLKPIAEYFQNQKLLSPNMFFIFALFHFPQDISDAQWEESLSFFPHAQSAAQTLFQSSAFRELNIQEGPAFTGRIQFLSWLLLGAGYSTPKELHDAAQANHFYTMIRQAKNNGRKKIFRYLLCLLLYSPSAAIEYIRSEWERLLCRVLHINPRTILLWKQDRGSLNDLYALVFTRYADFSTYRQASHLAEHQYQSFSTRFSILQKSFSEHWEEYLPTFGD